MKIVNHQLEVKVKDIESGKAYYHGVTKDMPFIKMDIGRHGPIYERLKDFVKAGNCIVMDPTDGQLMYCSEDTVVTPLQAELHISK
jgi:hypothetical protein